MEKWVISGRGTKRYSFANLRIFKLFRKSSSCAVLSLLDQEGVGGWLISKVIYHPQPLLKQEGREIQCGERKAGANQ